MEADHDGSRLKNEVLVTCKALKEAGTFVVITERLLLTVSSESFVELGKPGFRGIDADAEWVIEAEIGLESVIHADCDQNVLSIVGSSSETKLREQKKAMRTKQQQKLWNNSSVPLPLFLTNLEMNSKEEAEELLEILLSTIEQGKEKGWGSVHLLHQSNLK